MTTYDIKPRKSMNYIWLFFGIFFLLVTIGTFYVLLFLIPSDSGLPKSTYLVLLPFVAIAGFSFYKMKNQSQLASLHLTQVSVTNLKTNQTILWKNLGDLYFFSSGNVIGLANNLAYRTSGNETFEKITAVEYNIKDLETFENFHCQPRTLEVLNQIQNGKTVAFSYLPNNTLKQGFNLVESQFLNFDSDEILLNNKELIYKNKTYSLPDLSVIGLGNSGKYQLKTKQGMAIFEFNKLNFISSEVFRNVVNQLVKK